MRTLSGAIVILAACVLFQSQATAQQALALLLTVAGTVLVIFGLITERTQAQLERARKKRERELMERDPIVRSMRSFVTQSDEA